MPRNTGWSKTCLNFKGLENKRSSSLDSITAVIVGVIILVVEEFVSFLFFLFLSSLSHIKLITSIVNSGYDWSHGCGVSQKAWRVRMLPLFYLLLVMTGVSYTSIWASWCASTIWGD